MVGRRNNSRGSNELSKGLYGAIRVDTSGMEGRKEGGGEETAEFRYIPSESRLVRALI